jgi:hypothetical protein
MMGVGAMHSIRLAGRAFNPGTTHPPAQLANSLTRDRRVSGALTRCLCQKPQNRLPDPSAFKSSSLCGWDRDQSGG